MKLSREHRTRILGGDYRPLLFDTKPFDLEPGTEYVLGWSNPAPSTDPFGNVIRPEREKLFWLRFTSVVRRPDGRWLARFDVTDRRQPVRLLRRSPPVMTPDELSSSVDLSREQRAAEESAYTSSSWSAIDKLEAPPWDWQDRVSKHASSRDHERRLEAVARARAHRMRGLRGKPREGAA